MELSSRESQPSRTATPVRWALSLEAVGVSLFAIGVAILSTVEPDPTDEGFFGKPGYAALMLVAVIALLAAGVVALVTLVRDRPETPRGRWAFRLAVACSLALPLMGVVEGFFRLIDHRLPVGWGEPAMPFVLLAVIASVGLGAASREPGRRGLLMLPLILGSFVVVFVVGDMIFPDSGPTG